MFVGLVISVRYRYSLSERYSVTVPPRVMISPFLTLLKFFEKTKMESDVVSSLSGAVERRKMPVDALPVTRPRTFETVLPLRGEMNLLPLISAMVSAETVAIDRAAANATDVTFMVAVDSGCNLCRQ